MKELEEIIKGIYMMTAEQSKAIQEKSKEASYLNKNEIYNALKIINEEFDNDNVKNINKRDVAFYLDVIGNISLPSKALTENLFNRYFKIADLDRYSHFTSLESFQKIIESGKIRLYNLNKNFHQEFTDFYKIHGMDGYEKRIYKGKKYLEYLMSELFVFCLSPDYNDKRANQNWNHFGKGGHGIRLIFQVLQKRKDDFRKIHYYDKKNPLIAPIKNLNNIFLNKYNRHFLFSQTSKFGAFYIKNSMTDENEYRFLVKKDTDVYGFNSEIINDEVLTKREGRDISFIEEDFENPYAKFSLVAVQGGCYTDIDKIKDILSKNSFFNETEILPNFLEEEFLAED